MPRMDTQAISDVHTPPTPRSCQAERSAAPAAAAARASAPGGRLDPVEKIGTIRLMEFACAIDLGSWTSEVSRRLLEPLGKRWRHTLGVVERAGEVGGVLSRMDADLLVAAAYVHDVGYAPELQDTGLHPLDGARFIRSSGHERLAGLVAFHCSAAAEAEERGLLSELVEFADERSALSRALTYCDLTTNPDGQRIKPATRIAEIRRRYGTGAPEVRALDRWEPTLMDDVSAIESMLGAGGASIGRPRQRGAS